MKTNTGKQNHSGKVIPTHTETNMKKTESKGGKAVLPVHNVGFLKKKKEVPRGPNHPKSSNHGLAGKLLNLKIMYNYTYLKQEE